MNVVVTKLGQQTLDEHAHLRTVAEATASALVIPPGMPFEDPAGRGEVERWRAGVREKLQLLVAAAEAHFENEEKSPMYKGGSTFLRFSNALERLLSQHQQMRDQGKKLLSSIGESKPVDVAVAVRDFLDTLAAHEREENEILQASFTDDLGGGD